MGRFKEELEEKRASGGTFRRFLLSVSVSASVSPCIFVVLFRCFSFGFHQRPDCKKRSPDGPFVLKVVPSFVRRCRGEALGRGQATEEERCFCAVAWVLQLQEALEQEIRRQYVGPPPVDSYFGPQPSFRVNLCVPALG